MVYFIQVLQYVTETFESYATIIGLVLMNFTRQKYDSL
jgi:hypothetical protein